MVSKVGPGKADYIVRLRFIWTSKKYDENPK